MALTDIEAGRLADNVFNVVGANKNLIINGAMQVAQRGTSGTSGGYETVDRFLNDHGGGGAITQSQVALTSGTPYNEGFRYFWRQTNTTASTAAGRYVRAFQYIEAQNVANSGWNYVSATSYITLSFWVRSSVAQEFYGEIVTRDGTNQNYPFSTGSLSADTWTKVTKIIPGNSNITVNNDTGQGLQVELVPFYGTDFTDSGATVDAWQAYSGSSRVPDMTSTWANTTNATFDITGVQLEVGSVATPFEHRNYGDELARCQRYYFDATTGGTGGNVSWPSLLISAGGNYISHCKFPVTMRTPPSLVSASMTGTGNCFLNWSGSGSSTLNTVAVRHSSINTATIQGAQDSSFGGAGYYVHLEINNSFTGTYAWSAEL